MRQTFMSIYCTPCVFLAQLIQQMHVWRDIKSHSLPDDHTLVFSVNYHVSVHVVCQSINMWWVFILSLPEWKYIKSTMQYLDNLSTIYFLNKSGTLPEILRRELLKHTPKNRSHKLTWPQKRDI